jgi:hypothetical protein
MSADRHNLFTTADAAVIAEIMKKIDTYGPVVVMADGDADLHVGPDKWASIAQRLARHPEQFVGNYSGKSDPLEIADDLLSRKAELLKYGRAQRDLHPHLKWAR